MQITENRKDTTETRFMYDPWLAERKKIVAWKAEVFS